MGRRSSDRPADDDRPPPLTMRERAKKARHEAYLAAKERRKNDPRTAELKAKVKAARREASAQATERRKTDPKQVALKEKLKKERQAAAASGKEQRKARTAVAKKAERADKDEHLRLRIASADGGASLECIHGKPDVKALATTMPRSIAVGRAALTVIEGGKRPKTERPRSP